MKCLPLFLCLLVIAACATKTEIQSETSDTVYTSAIRDTSFITEPDTVVVDKSDIESLNVALDRLIEQLSQNESTFELHLSASGYEYQTDATWYFDSLFSLVACAQTWAAESREGKSYHFFEQDKLIALREEEDNQVKNDVTLYHRQLGGLSYSDGGDQPTDSSFTAIEPDFVKQTEGDLKTQLKNIVGTLQSKQAEMEETDEGITLHLENKITVGESTNSETSDITLNKKLLQKLLE